MDNALGRLSDDLSKTRAAIEVAKLMKAKLERKAGGTSDRIAFTVDAAVVMELGFSPPTKTQDGRLNKALQAVLEDLLPDAIDKALDALRADERKASRELILQASIEARP